MSVAREKLTAALRAFLDEIGFRDDVIVPVQFLADVLEILEGETSSTAAAVPLPLSGEGREDEARLLMMEEDDGK